MGKQAISSPGSANNEPYPPHTWKGAMQVLGIPEARATCLQATFDEDEQKKLVGMMAESDRQPKMREFVAEVEAKKKTATE